MARTTLSFGSIAAYILFLISPLLSLVVLARNFRSQAFFNVAWLFFGFLGIIIVTSNEASDVYRYSTWFNEYSNSSEQIQKSFFEEDIFIEVYRPLSFFLVSSFTDSSKIYLGFVALIFGYFYVGIIRMLLDNVLNRIGVFQLLFVLNFIFVFSFLGFQFVRFTTASVIFLYYFLRYSKNQDVKNILLSATSITIHFTFLFPVIILIGFHFFIKNKDLKIWYLLFLITSIITFVDFTVLKNIIEQYLPAELESKKGYLNEDYKMNVDESLSNVNWYIKYRADLLKFASLYIIYHLIFKFKTLDLQLVGILKFALFFGVFANIVSVVPSGFRFLVISNSLIWFAIAAFFLRNNLYSMNGIKVKILSGVIIFNIIIGFRYVFDIMPIELFIGNPILVFLGTSGVPLIEFIKG